MNNVVYGHSVNPIQSALRNRVLRLTLSSNSIFKLLDEIAIALFLSFFSTFLIKRFRGRLRGRLGFIVCLFAFLLRIISSTFSTLYTETPFNLIRLLLKCFFYLFKSCFCYLIYFYYFSILCFVYTIYTADIAFNSSWNIVRL